jgi:hypothetical protein
MLYENKIKKSFYHLIKEYKVNKYRKLKAELKKESSITIPCQHLTPFHPLPLL